jgi:allophanate hydrolase subunit 2
MNIHVLSPGLLTTVQDDGRHGFGAIGVGTAGAMDTVSLRLANLLVDNTQDAAALEITLRGPRLRFESDALVAVTGAEVDARCDGHIVPLWRPVLLRAGSKLNLGGMRRGCRAYLAVAGGIDLPAMLGSRSTDINAALGPIPRALVAGDVLPCASASRASCLELWKVVAARTKSFAENAQAVGAHPLADRAENPSFVCTNWSLDPAPWFDGNTAHPIRAIRGTHCANLDADSQRALFAAEFRIGVDSNRVGSRLEGMSLQLASKIELVSEGVATGTIQLPPGGTPIALTAEAPTTGGYPRIAHIIEIDQPRFAQLRPGDRVRFVETDLADAQQCFIERERALARLDGWVRARLRESCRD